MRQTILTVALCMVLLLSACAERGPRQHDYQIVISGSITPDPVEFAGSYTFVQNTREITRDLSGAGSFSVSVQGTELKRVRVQSLYGTGLLSLTVYEDGVVLFESLPSDSSAPILFTYVTQ